MLFDQTNSTTRWMDGGGRGRTHGRKLFGPFIHFIMIKRTTATRTRRLLSQVFHSDESTELQRV